MQIFVLDRDPQTCASYHCDKHVVKQILESAQLLCTAHWMTGGEAPYKPTHKNHPCAKWVRESLDNYTWLLSLANELCGEYFERYHKIHKTSNVIEWLLLHNPDIPENGMTPFVQAFPDEYKRDDPVRGYRTYYKHEKAYFAQWRYTPTPEWWDEGLL